MKTMLLTLIITIMAIFTFGSVFSQDASYNELWKKLEKASGKDLPKTVVEICDQILVKARKENNRGQLLKAYFVRCEHNIGITPDSLYFNLTELEAMASKENDPVAKMVLHSCIASVYSKYANENAWSLKRRTNVDGGEDTPDIREWGSIKFVNAVLENIDAALADYSALSKADNSPYQPFARQNLDGKYFKHDLLHIIYDRSLSSLTDIQELSYDKKALSKKREDILNKVIQTYSDAGNMEAYILASMHKAKEMNFGYGYVQALENLMDEKVKSYPVCAEILIELAEVLREREPAKALEYCRTGLKSYSSYRRTKYLKEIEEDILSPYASLTIPEYAYNGREEELTVSHKNIDNITIVFYKVPDSILSIIEKKGRKDLGLADLKKCQEVSKWEFPMERPKDYWKTNTGVKVKIPSEPGIYTFKMSVAGKEVCLWQLMSVGKMKIMQTSWQGNKLETIVVDRISGHPVKGAKVKLTYETRINNKLEEREIVSSTDKDGKAFFERPDGVSGFYSPEIVAELDDDIYMPKVRANFRYSDQDLTHESAKKFKLITDRSIYRPGQTVYVKGIAYDELADDAKVREGSTYTIELRNHNNEVVGSNSVVTNRFGSFETSFSIPSSGLMGTYTIKNLYGYDRTTIRVEEYKRPKFEVKSESPEGTFRIGDQVELKAYAKTFSGVPLQQADVKYTVTRNEWRWWSMNNSEILYKGELKTDDEGNIIIPVALTGQEDDAGDNIYYSFGVNIEVTDLAGETQSTTAFIFAGKKGLVLKFQNSGEGNELNRDKDIQIMFNATNLASKPIDTEVSWSLWTEKDGEKNVKVKEGRTKSNTQADMASWKKLASGNYILEYSAKDATGELCENYTNLKLFSLNDEAPIEGTDFWTLQEGEYIYFATSHKDAVVFLDIYAGNRNVESKLVGLSNQIVKHKFEYLPQYDDGVRMVLRMVKNDKMYDKTFVASKPVKNMNLKIKWSTFRDKLIPGQKEKWIMTVLSPDGKPADAEVLAFMYDASLDKIAPYYVNYPYHNSPRNIVQVNWSFQYSSSSRIYYDGGSSIYIPGLLFDSFINIPDILSSRRLYKSRLVEGGRALAKGAVESAAMVREEDSEHLGSALADDDRASDNNAEVIQDKGKTDIQEGRQTQIRTNFNETAFFLPQLVTDDRGNVAISFTLPESLTRYRFLSVAHTPDLMVGTDEKFVEAKKDFMISPNMPRFLRTGDNTTIASVLTNLSDKSVSANVKFELFDPATEKVFHTQTKKASAAAGKTTKVSFKFTVEDKYDVVGVRVVAEGGQFSDGEQHLLAVLSDKIRLVESVALPIRGNQKKEFSLESLFNHHSASVTKKTLTIEFTGNPAWYAVQALPSMAEPEDDCAICWTNALYANTLASAVANSQPKIKNVFEAWKNSGQNKETLLSNLQKNQELKTILLNESPWVLEANSEEDQKNMISTLFDVMTINNIKDKATRKLEELQMGDGGWTWFKGMVSSPWITEYVLTQDIRLKILTGEEMDYKRKQMHSKGIEYMHREAQEDYEYIMKEKIKNKGVSYFILKYFYLLALEAQANGTTPAKLVPAKYQKMYSYFLNKVGEDPKSLDMQEKALTAIVLHANGKDKLAQEYMQSIKEHLTSSEEKGMYFAFNENPYRWGSMNLNAQVAAIEAFDMVAKDVQTVEEMKLWLLKQKQTQMWSTSVMTADAVFALLARGENWLASEGIANLSFAGRSISTNKPDEEGRAPVPGLNYIKRAYTDAETTGAKNITVEKKDSGIAWGAAYATFFEKLSNVKENGGKEMSITKELYLKKAKNISEADKNKEAEGNGAIGYTLEPLKNGAKVKVGDIVTARMVIKIDRRMDFVQLKEQRAACFEPMTQLSGYRTGAGTGYYEEIKDASTNFFFYSLGKGTYVLEVNYRVSREGEYEAGLANLQCAYAPEYTAHTSSCRITVLE